MRRFQTSRSGRQANITAQLARADLLRSGHLLDYGQFAAVGASAALNAKEIQSGTHLVRKAFDGIRFHISAGVQVSRQAQMETGLCDWLLAELLRDFLSGRNRRRPLDS